MPVLEEVKEERADEQEIADLALKIKEANRAKLAQAAAYSSTQQHQQAAYPHQHPLTMARPGQPAIQQYFNGGAAPAANGQSNGTSAAANAPAVNGKPADASDKPVDEESKERWS
jgi:hypothetical protein